MADPWDNVPVVRVRDETLNQVVDVSRLSDEERLNLRVGQRIRLPDGTETRITAPPGRAEGGTPVAPDLNVAETPWANVPVITPGQDRAYDVAQSRIRNGDALNSGGQAFEQGVMVGFADELAGQVAGLGQLASNTVRRVTNQPIEINSADLRNAMTSGLRDEQQRFATEQPVANAGLQVAGGLLTGGAFGGGGGAVAAARAGGLAGAAYGAGSAEGGIVDRLPAAVIGGVTGALGGAALQQVGQRAIAPVAQSAGRRIVSMFGGAGGRSVEQRAASRLTNTIPDVNAAVAERTRLQGLGLDPTLVDVAPGTTERLVRAAALPAGPGADMAVQNSVRRTANLTPEVTADTQRLANDPASASAVAEGLRANRSTLADQMYPAAYETPVEVSDDLLRALADEPGRAALRRARAAAVARQNDTQIAEIDGLLNNSRTPVSAGTLDRVRIAMAGRGQAFNQRPDTRDIAGGLLNRAGQIDNALEAVPELGPARATYREMSGAIDAVEEAPSVFNTDPRDFQAWVRNLSEPQREAAIIGVRQNILDTLGGQAGGRASPLNRLTQSDYSRQNLAALLGQDAADQYLGSIQARLQQTQRAARISPNTNSQTAARMMDQQGFQTAEALGAVTDATGVFRGDIPAIARTIDRIAARAQMSPAEREVIVNLGLGPADELERIVGLAQQARQRGTRSREVRLYLDNARNVLGAQNPVTVKLEQLLLPAPVAAQEQPE